MTEIETYRRFRGEIAALLDPRCYGIEWLDQAIALGVVKVFGEDDGVIVTEVRQYPAGAREVHGMVAAGSFAAIIRLIERAEQWGRAQGCIFAGIASRPGWSRVLKSKGYEMHQVAVRKELI